MKHSDTLGALAPALVAAQGELKAVKKDSLNPAFKSSYASLDTILDSVRPVLAKHGLALVQGATTPHTDEQGRVLAFAVETMVVHSSGEWLSNAVILPLGKHDPQGAGGCLTYGRRYSAAALLALATEEDDDGNSAMPAPKAAPLPERRYPEGPVQRPAPAPKPVASTVAEVLPSVAAAAGSEPSCPKCQGPMWDNRLNKKNPKAPDYKCKDKACDGVVWPPKGARPAAPPPVPQNWDDAPTGLEQDPDDLPF